MPPVKKASNTTGYRYAMPNPDYNVLGMWAAPGGVRVLPDPFQLRAQ